MAIDISTEEVRPWTELETLSGSGTITTSITLGEQDRELHVRVDDTFEFRVGNTGASGWVVADQDSWTRVWTRHGNRDMRTYTVEVRASAGKKVYISAQGE
jgi:uncharacterized Zn finger protein